MTNQRLIISIILIIFLQINSYPSDNGFVKTVDVPDSTISKIASWFDEVDNPKLPGGYAVAIIKDGKVLLKKSYGFANEEFKVPFQSNTVFDFASIAKQFTGFAVATLIQQKKIFPDDYIRKYLPEIPDFGNKITISHLLNI